MEQDEFSRQPRTGKELANHYGVTPKTFRSWLKRMPVDLGTRLGNYYSPRQVKIITDHLSKPFFWIAAFLLKTFMGVDTDSQQDSNHGDESAKKP
jgi:hypothetical protein